MATIDMNQRSNLLLVTLAGLLSRASADVSETLAVWIKLVALEDQLKKEPSNLKVKKTCEDIACILLQRYRQLGDEPLLGSQTRDIIDVLISRLEMDYLPIFTERKLR